ncbi:MAG TPA: hypothetical protein VF993_07240 [Myxococcales bacterium]
MEAASEGAVAHRLAAGCAAGMALASAGTWLRFALSGTARIDTGGWPFIAASAVAGAGIILTGVCSLRLGPRAHRLSWPALWRWALAVQACSFPAQALTSSDVYTNLAFGTLSLTGLSPYAHSPAALGDSPLVALVPPRWVNDPTPYGPLFIPLARAAAWAGARAGSPIWVTFYAFKGILLAALLIALGLAARHLRAQAKSGAETFVALGLGPVLAWEISAQGHNDGLLVLAMVAFLVLAASGRELAGGVVLAAGVAVKYALAPLLGLHLLLVARGSPARAAVLVLLSSLLLAAAFIPEWNAVTLSAVLPMVGGETARHAHSFTDLVCLALDALGRPQASLRAYRALSAVSAAACGVALLAAAWRSRNLEQLARGYLVFLFALYLTAPWFQPWYLTWALPLLLVERDPQWRRFVALFAVVSVSQWALPLDPLTTVAADIWAATRIWRLPRADPPAAAS